MQNDAWQLQMFRRSLKKRAKMRTLISMLPELDNQRCLDVTCGDNTGSLNYYFRARGGRWTSADLEGRNLPVMMSLLQARVLHLDERHFAFPDDTFDVVVSIDCLEHLKEERPFLAELYRVTKPGGTAIVTVPNGDGRLLVNKVKKFIGMTPDKYGHVRPGYTADELAAVVRQVGFVVEKHAGYSRFFMESLELLINATYVLKMKKSEVPDGVIAPTSQEELKTHGLSYKLYSLAYPVLWLISRLDHVLFWGGHYAVAVRAVKPKVQG
ncbi:MAG: class I SAM-dependent methyltransferase [candidate division KSB1 bacterium]|nr:class I SAM-dependent methyltransferase [candidate division KSB1 bacterium]